MSEETLLGSFKRTHLASAVRASIPLLAAGAMVMDSPAYAQTPDSTDGVGDEVGGVEEIVVTGVRQSLQSAQALKQLSNVIVDSVTAEDIGALPDRSVTETLQRIPGVSIDRFSAGRDPDHFSVEGSGVVVRGLTYVRSEVNGRDSFTANNGRGLSFADVPPELLVGVDVFKSPSADRIEGGISGTVNLRTRKPFDTGEPLFAFSLESSYGDFIEESAPTGSVLGSYRWESDAGEFGILASFVNSQIKSRADRFQVSNFAERTLYSSGDVVDTGGGETPVGQVYFPRGAVMGTQVFDRERVGYSAAMQWRSPDESLEATFQFLRSDSREAWTEHAMEIATDVVSDDGRDTRAVAGTTFEFDASNVFDSGYITGPVGWRDDQWSGQSRLTPDVGLQSNNIRRDVDQQFITDDYALNFVWNLNDDWALSFDYQHVVSSVDNLDAGLWTSSYQDVMIDLNGTSLPTVGFTAPQEVCTGPPANDCPPFMDPNPGVSSYVDPQFSFYRSAMDHIEESDGKSDAFRIDAERLLPESSWMESIQFGYRYAKRDQTARFSTYNWGALSEIWGAGGPVWLNDPIASNGGAPLMGYEEFYFDNFFNGDTANPISSDGRLFYGQNIVDNYDAYTAYGTAIVEDWDPLSGNRWFPLKNRPGAQGWYVPGEINPVIEENNAVYLMLEFGNELSNGWNLTGNVGVRYTKTERESSGLKVFTNQSFTTEAECAAPPDPMAPLPPFCDLPLDVRNDARAFSNGAIVPFTDAETSLDDDHVLPSINLKLDAGNGLQFRAAYFQGVAPPDFGLTRAYYNVELATQQADIDAGNGRPVARFSAGNPQLKPVTSQNLDLTVEWYFAEVGQLSFAMFFKRLEDIRTNDIQRTTLTNNGASFDAIITTAVNSPETGKINGFEIAYQQTYDMLGGWLGGFGLQANYTYVDSSNVPQSTLSETDPDVSAGNQSTVDVGLLPLEGLSPHTFNITPFYDYGSWSARLAYSWRDEFLLTIRDVIVPFQPIMNEATGQLDGSVFYEISENWKIGLQGTNLTNEVIRTTAIINDDLLQAPRSWFMNDRRYSFILRGHF